MPREVLYICYNGIDEPLVQSQVLNYLGKLSQSGYRFTLLTFEGDRMDAARVGARRASLDEGGISWTWLPKNRFPGIFSRWIDVINGTGYASKLVERKRIELIHARSLIPGDVARRTRARTGVPYLFDTRGFWVDEKVCKGAIREGSIVYRLAKMMEKRVYINSDGIVSLTKKAAGEIRSFPWWMNGGKPPVEVIPTCVDLDAYIAGGNRGEGIVFGCVGSLGRGYLGREVFRFFRIAQEKYPGSRLLIVSGTDRQLIEGMCDHEGVDRQKVEIKRVNPEDVPAEVRRMDVGLSFIEPHYSKIASLPTKIGEYLACGVPVLANSGIGDVDSILQENGVGMILNDFREEGLRSAVMDMGRVIRNETVSRRCRETAERVFSLEMGCSKYAALYERIIK